MKYFIILVIFTISLLGIEESKNDYTIVEKQHNGKTLVIEHNTYKILEFSKRISDIRLSNDKMLKVIFIKNNKNPLTKIKVFAKQTGIINALITFSDKSVSQINFKVIADIREIKDIVNSISKDVKVTQVNNNIILKGLVKNNKIKKKIELLIKNTVKKRKLINLLEIVEPDKMVRLKLYVAEINNDKGKVIKNNWSLGVGQVGDLSVMNNKLGNTPLVGQALNKTSLDISSSMLNAVTLSGGITAVANRLGSTFDVGLTLNYLASNGVATVLDETELITLENKKSLFHAGGKIYIRLATEDKVSLKEIDYGLKLNLKVNNIINNEYVELNIITRQDKINWNEQVDGIPGFSNQVIKTNVIVKNNATIVLGGLISKNDARNMENIPGLSDIPILGHLFKSEDFRAGKSELVFFITPEIVEPVNNTIDDNLKNIKTKMVKLVYPPKSTMKKEVKFFGKKVVKIIKSIDFEKNTDDKQKLTNQELHDKRLKDIFGI